MVKKEIQSVSIAGAGTMGYSMGQIIAENGYEVLIYDISQEALKKAKELIEINIKDDSKQDVSAIMNKISFTTELTDLKEADFVIEAIVENLEIKKDFWKELSQIVSEDIVLCSNTSGLSITEIGEYVHKPERFVGMHWINPPHIIKLIEIIKGKETSNESAKIVEQFSEKLDKKPVVVKDAPGFVLNRLSLAVVREALHIQQEGIADAKAIDDIMKYGLGIRYASYGPLETVDFGGVDIIHNIAEYLFEDLSDANKDFGLMKELFESGDLGIKTGKGFYDYSEEDIGEVIRKRNKRFEAVIDALYDDLD